VEVCLKPDEIEAFVAGELSPADKTRYESHISSCSACRKAVNASERDKALAQVPQL
jgi:anti-sigma factor RsiW